MSIPDVIRVPMTAEEFQREQEKNATPGPHMPEAKTRLGRVARDAFQHSVYFGQPEIWDDVAIAVLRAYRAYVPNQSGNLWRCEACGRDGDLGRAVPDVVPCLCGNGQMVRVP
jgi:hypothetical protein